MKFQVYDVEVYPNYVGVGFMDQDGFVTQFSTLYNNLDQINDHLNQIEGRLFGFNNRAYDDHILAMLMAGKTDCAKIYAKSQERINAKEKWPTSPISGVVIDLRIIMVEDEWASLKEIGIKLRHDRLQELPFPYDQDLTPEQMEVVEDYNVNDLAITRKLTLKLWGDIEGREAIGAKYGVDVMERPDAQVAEQIVAKRLFADNRAKYAAVDNIVRSRLVQAGDLIHPKVGFRHPTLVEMFETVKAWALTCQVTETVDDTGRREKTKSLEPLPMAHKVSFGENIYTLALGGVHAKRTPEVFRSDDEYEIIDVDVNSYYPNLVSSLGVVPSQLDRIGFLTIIRELIADRLAAKAIDPVTGKQVDAALAQGLKIALNSVYGKFSSQYSFLFDNEASWRVILNGQMILMKLVELLTACDSEIINVNTDGVVFKAPRSQRANVELAVKSIGEDFNLGFSYTYYDIFAMRDGNAYIAQTTDGYIKAKGPYGAGSKNTHAVVKTAVQNYFKDGTALLDTIQACTTIADFLDYFACKGDWRIEDAAGNKVGKLARWYFSTGGTDLLKVSGDGAGAKRVEQDAWKGVVSVPDLPATLPTDIDYQRYVDEAQALVDAIEKPSITKDTCVEYDQMTPTQRKVFIANHADRTSDPARVGAVDLALWSGRYQAKGGNHNAMLGTLSWLYSQSDGELTHGDVLAIAKAMDADVGYFVGKKAVPLERMVDYVLRNRSPFKRVLTLEDHIAKAMKWAKTQNGGGKPYVDDGVGVVVGRASIKTFIKGRDVGKLATAIAIQARKKGFDLTIEQMNTIMQRAMLLAPITIPDDEKGLAENIISENEINIAEDGVTGVSSEDEEETTSVFPENTVTATPPSRKPATAPSPNIKRLIGRRWTYEATRDNLRKRIENV